MTTLTWPASIVPRDVAWRLESNTAAFTSPLSGQTQTYELPGARWVADFSLPPLQEAQWRTWTAFVARLRGQANRVAVPPFHLAGGSSAPRAGSGSGLTCDSATVTADSTAYTVDDMAFASIGTPRVNGASQSGASLATDGWTPAVTAFLAGDCFHYLTSSGQTLHMVVADAQVDSAGTATLQIEPPIRTAPDDNALLEIDAPTAVMMLADAGQGAAQFSPGVFASVQIALREVF